MKRFTSLFLLTFLLWPSVVFAGHDVTITCNNGSACTTSTELPLFSETNIYPGFTHSQIFSVDNNRDSTCHLKFTATSTTQVPSILSNKIFLDILAINNEREYSLVNYSLTDLLDSTKPPISLGHVHKDTKNNYLWSVIFSSDAGNEYQDQISNFNLNFNFECDEATTDNSANISHNPPSNQGTPNCTDSIPGAPTRLSATRLTSGNISLTWDHTASPHTGYLIAFGTSPNNYQYGAPNVGNVSSYTVQGLTYGAQYCFYVRSLNGCMPGGRTPEYCVNPGSIVVPANLVPTSFQAGVLGASTDQSSLGTVQGVNATPVCTRSWPYLLALALILSLIHFQIQIKLSKPNLIFKYLYPLFITILALIADYFINRQCYTFPLIFAPIALVLPYLYYLLIRRR